jgi:hypothetical protein
MDKTTTQTYFVPPFLKNYMMRGDLVKSSKIIQDTQIKEMIKNYEKDSDLEKFVFGIVFRYNEIKEKNKLPFQIDYIKKLINASKCPYGCVNQDIKCIDCIDGSHYVPTNVAKKLKY